MARYLIDVNLPYFFSLWQGEEYLHQRDLGDAWTDRQVWDYAKERNLTIVTKDADFSDRILLTQPPPRVIHIRLGNMKMRDFHQVLSRHWDAVCALTATTNWSRCFRTGSRPSTALEKGIGGFLDPLEARLLRSVKRSAGPFSACSATEIKGIP